jgi:hypothetical protein
MKVKCIANRGSDLPKKLLDEGYLATSEFDLIINQTYMVYGVMSWKGVINYLTLDKYESLPVWFPAELFTVMDETLPFEWYFDYFGFEQDISFLCGYKELVQERKHFEGLIERESDAIGVFIKRKKEIEDIFKS